MLVQTRHPVVLPWLPWPSRRRAEVGLPPATTASYNLASPGSISQKLPCWAAWRLSNRLECWSRVAGKPTGATARTEEQNVFWMQKMRYERVIRRSDPKTGRHRAGRTPYTLPVSPAGGRRPLCRKVWGAMPPPRCGWAGKSCGVSYGVTRDSLMSLRA